MKRPSLPKIRKKKPKTFIAFSKSEAKEILEKMDDDDTLVFDEEPVTGFSPIEIKGKKESKPAKKPKKKDTKKCKGCGAILPKTFPTKLCAPCMAEQYGSGPPSRPEELSARTEIIEDPEHATLIRDKKGNLTVKQVDVLHGGTGFRKKIAYVLILLVVCSSIISVVLPLLPTSGNTKWGELTEYYTVSVWLARTDSPDDLIPCAMKLYYYENDTWNELATHDWSAGIEVHDFGKIPIGMLCSPRASLEWGTWSPPPTTVNPFTLDSVTDYQLLTYAWGEYTIMVEITGSSH